MASKRDHSDLGDGEAPEPPVKRAKGNKSKSRQHQNSAIDPTWGQKYVFANNVDATTIPAGEESDFEDDADAMAYLMSVRTPRVLIRNEAIGIPHLLVAPKVQIGPQLPADFQLPQEADAGSEEGECEDDEEEPQLDRSIYTNGIGDSRGYYEDGAYISVPEAHEHLNTEYDEGEIDDDELEDDGETEQKRLHDAYFSSLLRQYQHLRGILNSTPPSNARSRLSPSQRTEVEPLHEKSSTTRMWSKLLHSTDPHPLQLALMPKDTVLRILRILLGGKFLRTGYQVDERTSRWLWALLARLPDRGELNHTEVGWVRDLGRRAVLLGRSLAEMAALRDELADGGLGVHERVDGSSSDEDVAAGEDSAANDIGVDSPGDESDVTAPTSDVAPGDEEDHEVEGKPHRVSSDVEHDDQASTSDLAPGQESSAPGKPRPGSESSLSQEESDEPPPDVVPNPTPPRSDIAPLGDRETMAHLDLEQEEGEIVDDPDDEDVAMDLGSDTSVEEGEAAEEEDDAFAGSELEAAKQRLLDQLDASTTSVDEDDKLARAELAAQERSRMNMRATLCMVLTVAGEFYGQRDLLEFREPFVGI